MNILGIDSSCDEISIALLCKGEVLGVRCLPPQITASRGLVLLLDELLQAADFSLERLDAIAVSGGPGSFTSLRIGISLVKGLAWVHNKPTAGIHTLDALAYKAVGAGTAPAIGQQICALLDAKQGQAYAALYRWQGDALLKVSEDLLLTPAQLAAHIKEKVLFAGAGVLPYREVLQKELGEAAVFANSDFYYPGAEVIARMGQRQIEEGKGLDAIQLTPYYIRRSHAEVAWEQRQG